MPVLLEQDPEEYRRRLAWLLTREGPDAAPMVAPPQDPIRLAQLLVGDPNGLPDSAPIWHGTQGLTPLADAFGARDRWGEEREAAEAERVWQSAPPVINPPPPSPARAGAPWPPPPPGAPWPVPVAPPPFAPAPTSNAAATLTANPMMSQRVAREFYDAAGVPPLSAGDTALDVARSTGIGLAKAPIQFLGMPGDVGSFAAAATDWAGRKLGASPETIDRIRQTGRQVFAANPMLAPFATAPASGEIQHGVESVTGKFYEPQTAIGEKAEALAGFVGGAAMPGGLARRVVGGVVAPFVGSELAAAIPGIHGTALEAPAKIAGGILGGVAGSTRAARAAPPSPASIPARMLDRPPPRAGETGVGAQAPGAGAAQRIAQPAQEFLESRSARIYDPWPQRARPFEADYPQGPRTDASGRLADIEGRPLDAEFVAGRRSVPGILAGTDEPLTASEVVAAATKATGGRPQAVARQQIGGDAGRYVVTRDRRSGQPIARDIFYDKALAAPPADRIIAHEFGHAVDEIVGGIPIDGIVRQLRTIYNDLNNPNLFARRKDFPKVDPQSSPSLHGYGPEQMGYKRADVRKELVGEAIRAYLTDPNYIKTVAPDAAKRIREYVNDHPELSKIIQFNALAGPTAAALFARELMREPPDDL